MNIIDKTVIKRFHQMRVQNFGEGTSKALGWHDDNSQLLRFTMLAGIGDMNNRSVLDVGCGYGDLSKFLYDKYPQLKYSGIDQSEDFLAIAQARYAYLPDTTFFIGDFTIADLPPTDYVLACGSLNYHTTEPGFIYKMITKLFNTCNIAFGFNLLSNVKNPNGILTAYNIDDIMGHCRTLTSQVILQDKYCDGDFTIWIYK
jgi:SAM-dependent methyltransferase